jgi:hypothetical protein
MGAPRQDRLLIYGNDEALSPACPEPFAEIARATNGRSQLTVRGRGPAIGSGSVPQAGVAYSRPAVGLTLVVTGGASRLQCLRRSPDAGAPTGGDACEGYRHTSAGLGLTVGQAPAA